MGGYLCDVMNTNWGVGSFANKTCRHQLSQFHRRSFRRNSPPRSAKSIPSLPRYTHASPPQRRSNEGPATALPWATVDVTRAPRRGTSPPSASSPRAAAAVRRSDRRRRGEVRVLARSTRTGSRANTRITRRRQEYAASSVGGGRRGKVYGVARSRARGCGRRGSRGDAQSTA